MKTKKVNMIDSFDFDHLVKKVYGKPYCFQQQEGCQDRGNVEVTVPAEEYDDEMAEAIPVKVNGPDMGVKFGTWLGADPDQFELETPEITEMFWHRNFYPDLGTLLNDLHSRGHIEEGNYIINIDW